MGGKESTCALRHILTKTKEESLKAKSRLDAGEDFAEVAAECSMCPSGKNGGVLGRRVRGAMPPSLDDVCFKPETRLGDTLGPIETDVGFHLVVVDERTGVPE